eukprot:8976052-Pyramimonas_sp.AAC.1
MPERWKGRGHTQAEGNPDRRGGGKRGAEWRRRERMRMTPQGRRRMAVGRVAVRGLGWWMKWKTGKERRIRGGRRKRRTVDPKWCLRGQTNISQTTRHNIKCVAQCIGSGGAKDRVACTSSLNHGGSCKKTAPIARPRALSAPLGVQTVG